MKEDFLVKKLKLPVSRVGHVRKRELDDGPVTMRNYDKSLIQIGRNHVIGMYIKNKAVVASSHTHF